MPTDGPSACEVKLLFDGVRGIIVPLGLVSSEADNGKQKSGVDSGASDPALPGSWKIFGCEWRLKALVVDRSPLGVVLDQTLPVLV